MNKFGHKWLKEETFAGLKCDVIERTPKYEKSGYTKQIAWIDQKDFQIRKVDFYDRKNSLLKTLELTDYKKYNGKFWRPLTMTMKNHQTGKSTVLTYEDFKFGVGLSDSAFVSSSLSRTR